MGICWHMLAGKLARNWHEKFGCSPWRYHGVDMTMSNIERGGSSWTRSTRWQLGMCGGADSMISRAGVETMRKRVLGGLAVLLVAGLLPISAVSFDDEGGVGYMGTEGETSVCTVGVTVKMKAGSIEKGYIMWPKNDPDGPDKEKLLARLLDQGRTHRYRPLYLMGRIRKIKYPSPRYASVKEDDRKIDALEVESISRYSALALRIGLPILHIPLASVETLSSVKPRFVAVFNGAGVDTVFVVCGANVGIKDLLAYIASRFATWREFQESGITVSVDGKDVWSWERYRGAEVLSKDPAYAPLIGSFSRIKSIIESTRQRDEKALVPCGGTQYPKYPDGCVDRKCQDEVDKRWSECRERIRRSLFVPDGGKVGASAPVWGRDIVVYYLAYD